MIFYDICITFGDEVEKIWKRRFTGATVLWFMVREESYRSVKASTNGEYRTDISIRSDISL